MSVLSVMWLELESVSEISSPRWSSVYECQSVECAFTSPVIIELGMLVMYCMQFVMSVSVVSMVSCCGVAVFLGAMYMLAMVMSLKCFVCIFRSCVSVLSVLMVCGVLMCVKCCVGLNVGDESASLLVFSVCADGSVVWYFGCPGCWVELRLLYCDDVRLCCEQ